jgi:hypothetical protein
MFIKLKPIAAGARHTFQFSPRSGKTLRVGTFDYYFAVLSPGAPMNLHGLRVRGIYSYCFAGFIKTTRVFKQYNPFRKIRTSQF